MSAEKGAHITTTSLIKPSIFEALAQESLDSILSSAFYYITDNWRNLAWADECFLSLKLLLQYVHLTYYSGSFSEFFYGLKRVPQNLKQGKGLNTSQFTRSLFFLCVLPYIEKKLQERYQNSVGTNSPPTLFTKCYPLTTFTYRLINLSLELMYTLGLKNVHSLPLLLSSTQLNTLSSEDNFKQPRILHLIGKTLSFSCFFLQFLNTWYIKNENASLLMPYIPPAPKKLLYVPPGICPICHKEFVIATALMTSGYVFCFKCISNHLATKKICPVTFYPSSAQQLVKIYQQ